MSAMSDEAQPVKKAEEKKKNEDVAFDPLSGLLNDPLSGMLNSSGPPLPMPSFKAVEKEDVKEKVEKMEPAYDWNLRREEILTNYEIEGNIKVKSVGIHL